MDDDYIIIDFVIFTVSFLLQITNDNRITEN